MTLAVCISSAPARLNFTDRLLYTDRDDEARPMWLVACVHDPKGHTFRVVAREWN